MTVDERIQEGDFKGALELLAPTIAGPSPDPGQVLIAFNLEVRLQRFAAAEHTMQRLLALTPELAEPMMAFARSARAEAKASARLTDPQLAGKRAAIGVPPPHALVYCQALACHAANKFDEAASVLAGVAAMTPKVAGTFIWRSGQSARFTELTDSDDLTGPILPCYAGEDLLDIPYSQIKMLTFGDPRTSFDSMWIPTEVVLADGQVVVVRVPALYAGSGSAADGLVATGRVTMWNRDHGYAVARGQRDFKLSKTDGGHTLVGIGQVRRIELDAPQAMDKPAEAPKKGFFRKLFS